MKQSDLSFDTSLNLFKEVFENVADIAVNLLNNDFTVLWANRTMAVNVERPLDEMIGKPCYEVWRRRSAPCPVCMLKIVSDTKRPCIMERWLDLPGKERRYAQVRAYPVFDEKGSVKHVFEILVPITKETLPHRRKGLQNFALANKHDLKLPKCIGVSIADDSEGYFTVEWIYLEFPWEPDLVLEEALRRNNPFREVNVADLPRYAYKNVR